MIFLMKFCANYSYKSCFQFILNGISYYFRILQGLSEGCEIV